MTTQEPPLPGYLRALRAFDRRIQQVEVATCLAALAVMVALAFAQVFLRQFRGVELGPLTVPQPVGWFDNIARHLVIWVGILGASLATAEGRHIAIEAVPKLLGPRGRRRVEVVTQLTALAVTGVLLSLCLIYMARLQIPNEAHLFDIEALGLQVYRWPLLVVVPIGLTLMCWRFGLRALAAVVLDDEAYEALRKQAADAEMAALDTAQEQERVDLLLQSSSRLRPADAAGEPADRESARAEVRRALGEGGPDAGAAAGEVAVTGAGLSGAGAALAAGATGAAGVTGAAAPATPTCAACGQELEQAGRERRACPECATWLHADCWSAQGVCPACARGTGPSAGRPPAVRSTDEIPVYRDLADDEDLVEPELRRSPPRVETSDDDLDVAVGDLAAGAEAAVEQVADTERLRLGQDVPAEDEPAPRRGGTDRLAPSELPGARRPPVVVVVRPRRSAGPEAEEVQ